MSHEPIHNLESNTETNSYAFYVFGGLSLISGIWSLIGNYFDPELTSTGVWILDTAIAIVGFVFIIIQYRLNSASISSSLTKKESLQLNKDKIKIPSKPKSPNWRSSGSKIHIQRRLL